MWWKGTKEVRTRDMLGYCCQIRKLVRGKWMTLEAKNDRGSALSLTMFTNPATVAGHIW
jgi:hypothetical protein